jgi:hypothetical protein
MDINDAFKINNIKKEIYSGKINYSSQCIYCSYNKSNPLLDDGSFRKCLYCHKHFKAKILTQPIKNYNESIIH